MKYLLVSTFLRTLGLPGWAARWLARLLLLGALTVSTSHLWAAELSGRVIGVADGDTITVLTPVKESLRVRLVGIDAPESSQAFGSASKRSLSDLVFGKAVTIRYNKQDRYGRILGTVFLGAADVNLMQIERGMAWHYKFYERDQSASDRQRYAHAEQGARTTGIGLWQDRDPTPPWDYRRSSK